METLSTESEAQRFSFEAFTRHPFFTDVNRWIVDRVIVPGRELIVDLGCGPGAVTKLILERSDPEARVIGIDPSESALARARAAIKSKTAEFIQGSAEWLSWLVSSVDAVVFLNAIHLVPDKAKVIGEIRKSLHVGGVFAFNTTFFDGAYVEGTTGFWRRWVVRAVQVLRERGLEVRREAHAVARQFLSADQYADLCVKAGFERPQVDLVRVEMTPESLEDIGRFSLFIEGALPGVPLEAGADALKEGLRRAQEDTGFSSVPRNWLECVATAV
jgi:ubiquinone/menaquinone biosynthesis C-methylase UbiE